MLSYIYGALSFMWLIIAGGFAEGGSLILGFICIGLCYMFFRLAWYESGRRRKKNRPR